MALLDTHYPLCQHSAFRFEATARCAAHVRAPEDIPAASIDPRVQGLPVLVLDGDSDIVLTRNLEGLVLLTESMGIATGCSMVGGREVRTVTAGGGELWHGLATHIVSHGLPGLGNLAPIPGTMGAVSIQGIDVYDVEIKDRFQSLRAYDRHTGEFITLTAADCVFGYRDSLFERADADRYTITEVTFTLPVDWQPDTHYTEFAHELVVQNITHPAAQDILDVVITIRRRKLPDPAGIGSTGNFFRNPIVDVVARDALDERSLNLAGYVQSDGTYKLAVDWLIDQCGFEGRQSGAVSMYEKQVLVLAHRGDGNAVQLMTLAHEIQGAVHARFGVRIEPGPVAV